MSATSRGTHNSTIIARQEISHTNSNSSNITMSKMRYFANPYPDYASATETPVVIPKDVNRKNIMSLLAEVFQKGSGQNFDAGLYLGPAGLAYVYLYLAEIPNLLTQDEKTIFQKKAIEELTSHLKYYKKEKERKIRREDEPAFLLNEGGVNMLASVFGKFCQDLQMHEQSQKALSRSAITCAETNFKSNELFVGRAGYLCGVLWLQQRQGGQPAPKECVKEIWTQMISSGTIYAEHAHSPCYLMYSYYDTEYLGAAHGLCAILQILLSFPCYLQEFPKSEELIHETIDYYLTLQDLEGNFPCAMDEVGHGRQRREQDKLVHWCHGAPGAVYLFAKAYLHYKDQKYLDACLKCGEVVWKKGLLRKGPGICHGVAGNGYVFLTIYKILISSGHSSPTSEEAQKQLYRASKFAEFLNEDIFLKEARTPDCPWSLFEGKAGTICFLANLLHPAPEKASFPFFDISYNYNPNEYCAPLQPVSL